MSINYVNQLLLTNHVNLGLVGAPVSNRDEKQKKQPTMAPVAPCPDSLLSLTLNCPALGVSEEKSRRHWSYKMFG